MYIRIHMYILAHSNDPHYPWCVADNSRNEYAARSSNLSVL